MVHSEKVLDRPLPSNRCRTAGGRAYPVPFDRLSSTELALWTALLKRDPFASPFLAPEFSRAVNQVSGNVFVAFLGFGDDAAFVPFQRKAYLPGIAHKVGGHMSDWFGVIGQKKKFDEPEILAATGLSVFCFDHWLRSECPLPSERISESQGTKVTVETPETYFSDLRKKDRKFVNEVERLERQVSESYGEIRFDWHSSESEMELERLIDLKRKQYQQSNAADALSSDW